MRLLHIPTGNVDSKVSGREERLVGRVRRRRLLVAVRHLKVISGLPPPSELTDIRGMLVMGVYQQFVLGL